MAKEPPKSTRAERLSRSLETIRAHQAITVASPALRVDSTQSVRPKKSLIKYPNNSTALRQHVEETRKTDKPKSPIRLRYTLASEATPEKPRPVSAEAVRVMRAPAVKKAVAGSVSLTHQSPPTAEPTVITTVLALGDVVRHARRRQSMSQSDVAAAAGTGRRFISELEAGKPTLEFERLLKVCQVLGITLLASEAER